MVRLRRLWISVGVTLVVTLLSGGCLCFGQAQDLPLQQVDFPKSTFGLRDLLTDVYSVYRIGDRKMPTSDNIGAFSSPVGGISESRHIAQTGRKPKTK